MFQRINRDVLIVTPKQEFIDWVDSVFPENEAEICPQPMAHDESNIYLIPETDHPDYAIEMLKENFLPIFVNELFDWITDEDVWPKDLSWDLFEKFFHYNIQTIVLDTVPKRILKDSY